MKSHFSDKVWRVFFTLIFVIGIICIPGARTSALQPSPDLAADSATVGSSYMPQVDMTPIFTQVSIGSGSRYTCAVTQDSTVKCWGRNDSGQLGDGTTLQRTAPVDVLIAPGGAPLSGVRSVATGMNHACALMSSGAVKCWGVNYWGQLGNGMTTDSTSPVDVLASPGGTPLTGVSAITSSSNHSCVQLTNGLIKCWGRNMRGQLGSGTSNYATTPATVLVSSGGAPLLGVSTVTAGGEHTCALMTSGGVKCWGYNYDGELGDNTNTQREYPIDVVGLSSGVSDVSAGYNHTCAVLTNGEVKCWGNNNNAQLGDGTTTARRIPVSVLSSPGSTTLNGIVDVSAGGYATCALTTAAGAKCWGGNAQGNLGDGTMLMSSTAVDVLVSPGGPPLGDVSKVITYGHSCALTTSGGVKCWGYNGNGQLGDGTNIDRYNPVDFTMKTPQTITITTPPPANAKYGTSFTVSAITSSGLDVNYKSSGSCTNVGATFTMITGVSTCTVTYEQPGDATYTFAPSLTSTVTAQKVAITVTADSKSKIYGDPDLALTYQITSGALVGADTFTGALSRAVGTHVGTYAILRNTLALNTGRYTLTYLGANLTITPRPITIQAEPKTKRVGEPDPTLTYQVTNGALVAPDGFTGALSRESGEDIGSYAITQGNLSLSSDYALTYAGANLTILSNELTVTKASDTNDGVCDNDCSLREAMDVTPNGGTIIFDASLAGQTITLFSTLVINKDLTVDGSALISRVGISGNDAVTVFEIAPGMVVTLKGMTITDGRAAEYDGSVIGGGIKNYGILHISNSMISNNIADPLLYGNGGGIYNAGHLDIKASIISNNSAYFGGGIQNFGESLVIRDSIISDNVAGEGGGVYNLGVLNVESSAFSNNSARGAGIINTGTVIVENSTFSGNSSDQEGGGILNYGQLTVTNSTLSGNSAATFGGGIYHGHGSMILANTILANSISSDDCYNDSTLGATIAANINNLVEVNSSAPNHCGSPAIIGDPKLQMLADNGGFTQTMALLPGSPAIDAGDDENCPDVDQRGMERPQGNRCDVGAYEYVHPPMPILIDPSGTLTSWDKSFHWTGLSTASWYELQVQTMSGTVVYDSWYTRLEAGCNTGINCGVTILPNLPNGEYQWRIQDYGPYGYGSWTTFQPFTLNLPNAQIILGEPSGTLTSWNKSFEWTGLSNASWYELQVQTTDGTVVYDEWYTSTATGCSSGTACAVTILPDLSNGEYQWRIQDYGPYGYGSWTSFQPFTLNLSATGIVLHDPTGTLTSWDKSFHWTGLSNASWYELQVQTMSGTVVYDQWYGASEVGCGTGTACAITILPDLPNGEYQWRIQDYGPYGYGSWTTFQHFTLNLSTVGIVLENPSGTLTSWDKSFEWTGLSNATWYELQVQKTDGTIVYDEWYTRLQAGCNTGSACAVTILPDLPNGEYQWRIQDYGPYGYGSWTTFQLFTLNLPDAEIVLGDPTGTLTSWDKSFGWTGLSNATWYALQVQTSDGTIAYDEWYTSSETGCGTGTTCAITILPNLPNGDYQWRIQDYGPYGYGSWTTFQPFTLNLPDAQVMLGDPIGTLTSWDGTFEWTGVSASTYYFLEVEQNGAVILGKWYSVADVCTGTSCSVAPAELSVLPNGNYQWRLQDYGGYGYGSFTNFQSFILDAPVVVLNAPLGTLTNWNNSFQWTGIPSAESYHVQVYDGQDNLVQEEWYTLGVCTGMNCDVSPLETQNLASGEYKWRLQTDGIGGYTPWTDFATFTLMPASQVILDEFDGTLLGLDWEWYVPAVGPIYSLSEEPDYIQLVVPPDKDHWNDLDTAPQVRRTDMGAGDWSIETYISLDENNTGDQWQVNLMAGFDRYDQQWLSIDNYNTLNVMRVGEGDTAVTYDISLPLYLRIEKVGSDYTFKYKENTEEPWTILDTQTIDTNVSYVGLQTRTFSSSTGDLVLNMDYFRLERSSQPDPGPAKEIEQDDFDQPTLNPDWTWYVQKAGPAYSLSAVIDAFRMILPGQNSFEHWIDIDEAPQLKRSDLGTGDWAIEARLENVSAADDASYWVALFVGFDQYDQIWYGKDDSGGLRSLCISERDYFAIEGLDLPLTLRLEKHGEEYTFKYKYDPHEAWTVSAPYLVSGIPEYVGLIVRSPDTGSASLQADWSYFRIERWEAEQEE